MSWEEKVRQALLWRPEGLSKFELHESFTLIDADLDANGLVALPHEPLAPLWVAQLS